MEGLFRLFLSRAHALRTPPRNPALPPHKGQQRIQQSKIPRTHRECSLLHLPRLRGVSLPCGVAHALFFSPARRRPRRLSSTGSGSHSRAREFVVSPPDSLLPVRFRTTLRLFSRVFLHRSNAAQAAAKYGVSRDTSTRSRLPRVVR